jgi:hypothetical protein
MPWKVSTTPGMRGRRILLLTGALTMRAPQVLWTMIHAVSHVPPVKTIIAMTTTLFRGVRVFSLKMNARMIAPGTW